MIKHPDQFIGEIRKNARGGEGEVLFSAIWKPVKRSIWSGRSHCRRWKSCRWCAPGNRNGSKRERSIAA